MLFCTLSCFHSRTYTHSHADKHTGNGHWIKQVYDYFGYSLKISQYALREKKERFFYTQQQTLSSTPKPHFRIWINWIMHLWFSYVILDKKFQHVPDWNSLVYKISWGLVYETASPHVTCKASLSLSLSLFTDSYKYQRDSGGLIC